MLNFIEFKDPSKVVDVPSNEVRAALARIAARNPDDPRPKELLKLLG